MLGKIINTKANVDLTFAEELQNPYETSYSVLARGRAVSAPERRQMIKPVGTRLRLEDGHESNESHWMSVSEQGKSSFSV